MFSLIGNTPIQRLLQSMVETNHVPSTLLFEGPKGVGKGEFAAAFAEKLLGGCIRADLRHFYPEGKTAMHSMEAVREFIGETVLPPFEAERRVFIIHDADRMLPSSSNALLKTLEEPAPHNVIILTSSHPAALLPTITSRCMTLTFSLLNEEEVTEYLTQNKNLPTEEARTLARLSRGSLKKANLLSEGQSQELTKLIATIGRAAVERDSMALSEAISALEQTVKQDTETPTHEQYEDILHALFSWFRDLNLLKLDRTSQNLFFQNYKESLTACLSHPIPSLDSIQSKIERALEALEVNIPFSSAFPSIF